MRYSTRRATTRCARPVVTALVLVSTLSLTAACSPRPEATASPAPASALRAPAAPPTPTAPRALPADPAAGAPVAVVPVRSAGLEVAVPAAAAPVLVTIPAISVQVPVDPVGVTADGQMEIPPLAERAGWYRFGPAPGETEGSAVVAAHVDSVASAGLGPFARLADLTPGDLVEVTLADGTARSFAVSQTLRIPKPEVAWPDVFTRGGEHRLVLVTCSGRFQRDVGHYSDNTIVIAHPLDR